MNASLVDNGTITGCISDISSGTFDVTVIVDKKKIDNTVHIDPDPSKMIDSLKTTANIPNGFKYFYLTIIGVTGTLLVAITLLLTTAFF